MFIPVFTSPRDFQQLPRCPPFQNKASLHHSSSLLLPGLKALQAFPGLGLGPRDPPPGKPHCNEPPGPWSKSGGQNHVGSSPGSQ
eukprot:5208650-Prorocentrum_lima.AAC.1